MPKRLTWLQAARFNLDLLRGQYADLAGLGLGLLMIAGVFIKYAVGAPIGPPTRTDGVVQSLNLATQTPRALISVHDTQVIIYDGLLRQCRVGDRIPLYRHKAPVGFRYRLPLDACRARRP